MSFTNFQEHTVKLTSTNNWTAQTSDSWIEVVPQTGTQCANKDITIRIEDNPNNATRRGNVNFRTPNKSCTLNINQEANPNVAIIDNITLTPSNYTFTDVGGQVTCNVYSEAYSWTATTTNGWITLNKTTGGTGTTPITISVSPNDEETPKNGSIVFTTDGGSSATFNVVVNGLIIPDEIFLSDTGYTFPHTGGNHTITVSSLKNNWAAQVPEGVTVNPSTGGTGTTPITISVSPNNGGDAITKEISFNTTEGAQENFTLTIEGISDAISISQRTMSFQSTGGSRGISVESSINGWTGVSNREWISLSPTTGGVGATIVEITAEANTGTTQQSGTITFTTTAGASQTITITVAAPSSQPSQGCGPLYANVNFEDPRGGYTIIPNVLAAVDGKNTIEELNEIGVYKVPITSNGMTELDLDVPVNATCVDGFGHPDHDDHNLMFLYPSEAEFIGADIWNGIYGAFQSYADETTINENTFVINGTQYKAVILGETYGSCWQQMGDNGRFKLTFNNGISK